MNRRKAPSRDDAGHPILDVYTKKRREKTGRARRAML